MKRYLLFFGEQYYPSQGVGDLVGDFDTLHEAKERFNEVSEITIKEDFCENISELMQTKYSLIYDSEIKLDVWNYEDKI